jgi:hypothetical protein
MFDMVDACSLNLLPYQMRAKLLASARPELVKVGLGFGGYEGFTKTRI